MRLGATPHLQIVVWHVTPANIAEIFRVSAEGASFFFRTKEFTDVSGNLLPPYSE
jgi:hypothetical protein